MGNRKGLVAVAALAGMCQVGAAQAQSSVTLYGVVDVNIETFNNSPGGSASGMRSSGLNGSRWGFRGSEDLGGGLKAVFQLEGGMNVRDGRDDGRLFQRTSMVGLEGDWGELTFGRQYTSSFSLTSPIAPLGFGPQYEPSSRFVPVRVDNAVRYRGKLGGLDAIAYYAFREQTEQITDDASVTGGFGVGGAYTMGMFRFVGAYDRTEEPAGSTTTGDTDNYLLGVRVSPGKFKLSAIYRHRRIEQLLSSDIKSHLYSLGLGYQFTPAAAFELAYYREDFKNAPDGYLGTTDDKWQQLSLRATYALSKRTSLYAVMAHARDGALNLGSNGDVGGARYELGAGKTKQTGGAIGMRHNF